ncbi:MAG: CPBP family intramembrane glutamic endopeptidase [Flavitalea sp.]
MKESKGSWKYAALFIVIYISILMGMGIVFAMLDGVAFLDNEYFLVVFPSLVSIVMVLLISRSWNHWSPEELGFEKNQVIKPLVYGSLFATFLLLIGTLILYLSGSIHLSTSGVSPTKIILPLLAFILVAIGEEMIFRGYILNNLLYSFNKTNALLISGIIFALFHSMNPSVSWISILNIFAGGILLGATYLYKKNLWIPIGFHFAWNFVQGPVLGFPVSGLSFPSLFSQTSSGSELLTGGAFGFEGSIIQFVVCILGMLWLSFVKQN